MSFKMMEGDFLGNQEESGYTLMHAGPSPWDHTAAHPDARRAHTHIHTTTRRCTLIF